MRRNTRITDKGESTIISSDHGENFGELGIYAEHGSADQPATRIPMIVRWPGMKSGHVDDGLHYNLDYPHAGEEWEGDTRISRDAVPHVVEG